MCGVRNGLEKPYGVPVPFEGTLIEQLVGEGDALKILSWLLCGEMVKGEDAQISTTRRAWRLASHHDQGNRAAKDILE